MRKPMRPTNVSRGGGGGSAPKPSSHLVLWKPCKPCDNSLPPTPQPRHEEICLGNTAEVNRPWGSRAQATHDITRFPRPPTWLPCAPSPHTNKYEAVVPHRYRLHSRPPSNQATLQGTSSEHYRTPSGPLPCPAPPLWASIGRHRLQALQGAELRGGWAAKRGGEGTTAAGGGYARWAINGCGAGGVT